MDRTARIIRRDRRRCLTVVSGLAVLLTTVPGMAQNAIDPQWLDKKIDASQGPPPHMAESLRSTIDKVIVVSGRQVAGEEVDGTYGRSTPGLVDGAIAGRRMGTVSRQIGGVPVYIPIPGLQLPGAILGALTGATKREIQDFRDALTKDLLESDSPPLRSDSLASDTFWGIRRLPHVESHLYSPNKAIPEDADAVLYTNFDDLSIEIDGSDAIITTTAVGSLYRPGDDVPLYETRIAYQDRDTLSNWTADDTALWRSYANFARFHLGRAIAADMFKRVEVSHQLRPVGSADVKVVGKTGQQQTTASLAPTLAWNIELDGEDAYGWTEELGEADIAWDLEIFDNRTLVYEAEGLPGPTHTLGYPLESCGRYRWSVRPIFNAGGEVRFGDWMRFDYQPDKKKKKEDPVAAAAANSFGKGVRGRQASVAHAHVQDYALLEVSCRD